MEKIDFFDAVLIRIILLVAVSLLLYQAVFLISGGVSDANSDYTCDTVFVEKVDGCTDPGLCSFKATNGKSGWVTIPAKGAAVCAFFIKEN